MAAIPAAPASRQARAFCSVIPPRARTGIEAWQACARAVRPVGRALGEFFFSKTGAKTAKSAPACAAAETSSALWQETAIKKGDAGALGSLSVDLQARTTTRTSPGERSCDRR